MPQNNETNPPDHYWSIAEDYIAQQAEQLEETEYYLDGDFAYTCVQLSSMLKHTSGSLAGVNFQFQEWQIYAIIDIFGTKYRNGRHKGLRRYQRALFFMPKKNGKSEFAGVLHAIMFFLDGDRSKEQYSIATEAEQAKIIHKVFLTMLKQEPELFELVHTTVKPPRITKDDGPFTDEFQSLTSTADTKDGLRPSFLTVDEGHAHDTKDLYQIMTDGLAGRDEPLEVHLSTAGYNKQGFFYTDIYLHAKKVKQGIVKDDRFYAVLFEPDEEDMKDPDFWKKDEIWKKVNPNLGISPTYSYMEGKIAAAESSAQSLIAFKTKHLNVWCDQADTWLKDADWVESGTGEVSEDELIGEPCFAGLDLASITDIAAWVLLFPKGNDYYDALFRFFIPEENMQERVRTDKVPYFDWHQDGELMTTPGNVIDYDFIEAQIRKDCEKFDVKEIAFDRWNASSIVTRLDEDEVSTMVPFGQGFAMMSAPTKELEALVLQKKLNHGGNKPMRWMISNIAIKRDPADNIKIDKKKSSEKVDGPVALVMALGRATVHKEEDTSSVYEQRGLRKL